jgi:hypothetical protein
MKRGAFSGPDVIILPTFVGHAALVRTCVALTPERTATESSRAVRPLRRGPQPRAEQDADTERAA